MRFVAFTFTLLAASVSLFAQPPQPLPAQPPAGQPQTGQTAPGQGKIQGKVCTDTGTVIPNAVVIVVNSADPTSSQRVLSAPDGTFTIDVAPGTYRVEVESPGYKRAVQNDLVIAATVCIEMDVRMAPGNPVETVEIRARAILIQLGPEVARDYDARIVRELPVLDRNIQEFVGLMPGVTPPLPVNPIVDPQRNRLWHANGQPFFANNKLFDALTNTDPFNTFEITIPPVQAARDYQVRTLNYTADGGRAGGTITNTNSSAGTNALHGSLFEFFAPNRYSARSFFNIEPFGQPHSVSHQFGGSVGFPIMKDKLFGFLSYEGSRLHQSVFNISTVPTAAFRTGDFSGLPGVTIFDPTTGDPVTGLGRTAFLGNVVPAASINPIAADLAAQTPLPNLPGVINNLATNVPFQNVGNRPVGRVDWRASSSTYVFFRYAMSNFDVRQGSALGSIGSPGNNLLRNHNAMFNVSQNFSPSVTTEVRLGFTRAASNPRPADAGLLSATTTAAFLPTGGLPYTQISGFSALGASPLFSGVPNTTNDWNLANVWGWQKGRHSITFGADAWWIRGNGFLNEQFGPRGAFLFSPGPTIDPATATLNPLTTVANSYAAFLLGAPTKIGQDVPVARPKFANWQVAGFAADRIQLGPNLTLNLGIRYDVFTPLGLRSRNGFFAYNAVSNTLVDATTLGKWGGQDWDFNNVAPRVGIAWRINDRTAVRGGYSITYWKQPLVLDSALFIPGASGFQSGVPYSLIPGGTFGAIPAAPAPGVLAPNNNFIAMPSKLETPYTQQYFAMVQRDIGWTTVADVSYVGTLGRHLPFTRDLNAALPGTGFAGQPFNNAAFGFRTASTLQRDNGLNSNFNSLQVNATKRFSKLFAFTAGYTYSRSMDFGNPLPAFTDPFVGASGITPLLNPFDRSANYASSDWDRRHNIIFSHLFQLPFGPGAPYVNSGIWAQILGQWQINGIFRWARTTPFTVLADPTLCNCPNLQITADNVPSVSPIGSPAGFDPFFGLAPTTLDPNAFSQPGPGLFGTLGRNSLRSRNLTNYNLSAFRNFPIMDRFKLEFRAEAYNIANSPNFGNPNSNINSLQFGQDTNIVPGFGSRTLQLALRVVF